jgi:hypothetical protein
VGSGEITEEKRGKESMRIRITVTFMKVFLSSTKAEILKKEISTQKEPIRELGPEKTFLIAPNKIQFYVPVSL